VGPVRVTRTGTTFISTYAPKWGKSRKVGPIRENPSNVSSRIGTEFVCSNRPTWLEKVATPDSHFRTNLQLILQKRLMDSCPLLGQRGAYERNGQLRREAMPPNRTNYHPRVRRERQPQRLYESSAKSVRHRPTLVQFRYARNNSPGRGPNRQLPARGVLRPDRVIEKL